MSTRVTRDPSKATGSEEPPVAVARTRSGRISKPPVRYEPVEQVEDDYDDEDYDTEESAIDSDASSDASDEEDDEEDADDDGNLDGFVVPDKSETSDSDSEDGKPPVHVPVGRSAVKKRPVARK